MAKAITPRIFAPGGQTDEYRRTQPFIPARQPKATIASVKHHRLSEQMKPRHAAGEEFQP